MQIRAINYTNSFKGLWGDTIKYNDRKQSLVGLEIFDYETKKYYPFGDESIEAIANIQKNNSTYNLTRNTLNNGAYVARHTGTNISIKQPLLFSAKQWFLYISNKLALGEHEIKLIENNLKNLHLEKYLKV